MDNAICMEKCEGHCNVVRDVDLNVVRDLLSGRFQKVSQAVVHELHQKNWETSVGICVCTQVLYDIGVSYCVEKLTLLLKPPDGQPVLTMTSSRHLLLGCWIKESFVDDFSSAGKVVTLCSTHFAIESNAEGLLFEELDAFEAYSYRTHCGWLILSRHISLHKITSRCSCLE